MKKLLLILICLFVSFEVQSEEQDNIDYSKYSRSFFDCSFEKEIQEFNSRKEVRLIKETESYCFNESLNYFYLQHCMFGNTRHESDGWKQLSIKFSDKEISEKFKIMYSIRNIIINLETKTISKELRVHDDKNIYLGKSVKYGKCKKRGNTRLF